MGNRLKLIVSLGLALIALALAEDAKKEGDNTNPEKEERLGLVASALGVPPVPGYVPEGGQALISGSGGNFDTEPIPIIGGGGALPYAGGGQGGNGPCQCVPVEHCPSQGGGGGSLPVIEVPKEPEPGYGPGDVNPPIDGAGVIDIRIVNKPPGPGGVQCSPGQVFCCGIINKPTAPPVGGGGDHFPGGGYTGCGKRSFIDVPGYAHEYGQAKFGEHPWMAVILGKGNNYIGAGALINSHYVLTAAHKVSAWKPGSHMKVRLGEWNAKDDDEPYKNVEIDVENIIIHPQFNPDNLYNDIALIRLAKPIDVHAFPHIRSVCLPKPYANPVGQRCWVGGFGKDAFGSGKHSYIMKEVDLPIVDSNICENLLRGTRLGRYFELNKHSFLCAGGEEGKDACTGDGGSPLVCETSTGVWNVMGLVAWGIGCADYGVPGVYVNVPNYLEWIENNVDFKY